LGNTNNWFSSHVRRNADTVSASKGCVKSMSRTTAPSGASIFSKEKEAAGVFIVTGIEKGLTRGRAYFKNQSLE
jgi:hypothetical protein